MQGWNEMSNAGDSNFVANILECWLGWKTVGVKVIFFVGETW